MKKLTFFIIFCCAVFPALAAVQENQARRSVASQMVMSAPRATASTNDISAIAGVDKSSVRVEPSPQQITGAVVNNRDKEKEVCINSNIGIGDTFVWASRYSNSNNYATMVEDVENPDNNVCFAKVSIKSNDSKINVSDIPSRYFELGQIVTCGEWADEDALRQRILDAKKTARTWATVGGVVGGAGIGVGAMELFGNTLIGGKVEGQEDLTTDEKLLSHLLVLKRDKDPQYYDFVTALKTLKTECEKIEDNVPSECSKYNYEYLLNVENIN